ncbi:MAG: phosphatidate cytidylyltransferase [Paludibacteraceae bacterium]|nr:phosphatidate cytidylyltransferase [Paludibacteraceae bacterium]
MQLPNIVVRTISGAVFVGLIIGALLVPSSVPFGILFSLLMMLAVREFHTLTNDKHQADVGPWVGMLGGLLLFVGEYLLQEGDYPMPWAVAVLEVAYPMFIAGFVIYQIFGKRENPVRSIAYFVAGQVVIAYPFALLCSLYNKPLLLLAVFVTIWVNDTWAYLFGTMLGKHKMIPRVSPGKSWEGFVGGAVMSLLTGWLCSLVMPEYSVWMWMLFAEVIVVFGTLGDLTESLFKRTLGVKDSGNLIPGHGGVLDRLDSTLLAVPAMHILLTILDIINGNTLFALTL